MSLTPAEALRELAGYNSFDIIGILLNWGFYGALCAQVYLYYLAFPEDRILNKALVYGVSFLETVQAVFLLSESVLVYDIASLHRSLFSLGPAGSNRWILVSTYSSISLIGGIVAFVVQIFYIYRLCMLSRSWVVGAVIAFLALLQLTTAIIGDDQMLPVLVSVLNISLLAWGILSIVCDTVIAVAMTYFLLRTDTQWKTTHTLLVKLVRLAIETGAVTVIVAVTYLILYYSPTLPDVTPRYILGKVYSNTMMVNLNHRMRFSGGRDADENTQVEHLSMPFVPSSTYYSASNVEG